MRSAEVSCAFSCSLVSGASYFRNAAVNSRKYLLRLARSRDPISRRTAASACICAACCRTPEMDDSFTSPVLTRLVLLPMLVWRVRLRLRIAQDLSRIGKGTALALPKAFPMRLLPPQGSSLTNHANSAHKPDRRHHRNQP